VSTAAHEAAHCVMALQLGYVVNEVRIDGPEDGTTGWVDLDRDERDLELGDLMVQLAGGMVSPNGATDYEGWPPTWPVLPGRGDQGQIRALVRALHIPEQIYRRTCELTEECCGEPEFRHLVHRISAALDRVPVLSREDLEYLVGAERIASYRSNGQRTWPSRAFGGVT
jgi:hypothetical protein